MENMKTAYTRKGKLKEALNLEWYMKNHGKRKQEENRG
jgi:hypothetical protein